MAAPRVYDWNQSDDPTGNSLAKNVPGWTALWEANTTADPDTFTLTAAGELSVPASVVYQIGLMHDANSVDPWVYFTVNNTTFGGVSGEIRLRANGYETGIVLAWSTTQLVIAKRINNIGSRSTFAASVSSTVATGSRFRARVTGTGTSTTITVQKWNGSTWGSVSRNTGGNFDALNLGLTAAEAAYTDRACGVYITSVGGNSAMLLGEVTIEPQPSVLIKLTQPGNRRAYAFDPGSTTVRTHTFPYTVEGGALGGPLQYSVRKIDGTLATDWTAPTSQDGTQFVAPIPKAGWVLVGARDSANPTVEAWTIMRWGPGEVIMDDGQSLRAAFGSTTGASGTGHDRSIETGYTYSYGTGTVTKFGTGFSRNLGNIVRGNVMCAADPDLLVMFVNSATGATSMADHTPPSGGEWTKTNAVNSQIGWEITRVVFQQGQADSGMTSTTDYINNFTAMAAAIRTAAGRTAAQLPIYTVLLGRYDTNFSGATGTDASWSLTREAQLKLAGEWPGYAGLANVKLLWEEMTFAHADGLHLTTTSTTNGYYRAAETEARALLYEMGISTWRPRVVPSTLTQIASNQYALAFDKSALPAGTTLSLRNANALLGYQLLDGTSAVIIGVTVAWDSATERVIFTLPASPPPGPYKARSFWGRDPFAGITYANANWVQADIEANTGSGYKVPVGQTRSIIEAAAGGGSPVDLSGAGATLSFSSGSAATDPGSAVATSGAQASLSFAAGSDAVSAGTAIVLAGASSSVAMLSGSDGVSSGTSIVLSGVGGAIGFVTTSAAVDPGAAISLSALQATMDLPIGQISILSGNTTGLDALGAVLSLMSAQAAVDPGSAVSIDGVGAFIDLNTGVASVAAGAPVLLSGGEVAVDLFGGQAAVTSSGPAVLAGLGAITDLVTGRTQLDGITVSFVPRGTPVTKVIRWPTTMVRR